MTPSPRRLRAAQLHGKVLGMPIPLARFASPGALRKLQVADGRSNSEHRCRPEPHSPPDSEGHDELVGELEAEVENTSEKTRQVNREVRRVPTLRKSRPKPASRLWWTSSCVSAPTWSWSGCSWSCKRSAICKTVSWAPRARARCAP